MSIPNGKSVDPVPANWRKVTTGEMWRLGGLSLREFLRRVSRQVIKLNLGGRSAQFAFYAIFSTAPLLILILAAAIALPIGGLIESFIQAIQAGMPKESADLLRRQIASIHLATGWTMASGAGLLLAFSGSRIFLTLGEGFDAAYGVETRRHFLKERMISIVMAYLVFVLLVLTMILLVFGPRVTQLTLRELHLQEFQTIAYHLIRWGIAAGFMLISSSFLYWIIPHQKLAWHAVSPGSLFAAVGWVAVTIGVGAYVDSFEQFNETYGTLGGIIILLTWFQLTGYLLFLGGAINGVITRAAQDLNRK